MSAVTEKNKKTGRRLALIVLAMLALTAISVPLYSVFCRATGLGGATQVAKAAPVQVLDRTVTIRFNTDVEPGLPWSFQSESPPVKVRLGEVRQLLFAASNHGDKSYDGVSLYNVLPERAGLYFNKIQCFCFDAKTLKPGEHAEFPVQFFVDPALAKDPLMDGVDTITLSYTFFSAKSSHLKQAQAAFDAWQKRMIEMLKN